MAQAHPVVRVRQHFLQGTTHEDMQMEMYTIIYKAHRA